MTTMPAPLNNIALQIDQRSNDTHIYTTRGMRSNYVDIKSEGSSKYSGMGTGKEKKT